MSRTEETDAEFRRLWTEGVPIETIADNFKIGRRRASGWARELDLRPRQRGLILTPEREQTLRTLWAAGETTRDIARALDVGETTTRRWRKSLGLNHRGPGHDRSIWPPERIEELRRLKSEGLTNVQIARIMDTTRNAIIGKTYRLGLNGPSPARPKKSKRKTRLVMPQIKPIPELPKVAEPKPRPPSDGPAMAPPPDPPKPTTGRRRLSPTVQAVLDLGKHDCRFPIGDAGSDEFKFCGAAVKPNTVYCKAHCDLAFRSARSIREARDQAEAQGLRVKAQGSKYNMPAP